MLSCRLSNLFNAIPRRSSLRLPVYNTLLENATSQNELDLLKLNQKTVESWLLEWDISNEAKSTFLKSIVDAYTKAGEQYVYSRNKVHGLTMSTRETAYAYNLLYVKSLDPSSAAGKAGAVKAIASALRIPSVLDFDPLFKLEAVTSVKDHDLFSLLRIFLNDGLHDFRKWDASHTGAISKYGERFLFPYISEILMIGITGLENVQLERKIRLLTLASIAFKFVAHDLPYSTIATELDIDNSDVEKWVIDGTVPSWIFMNREAENILQVSEQVLLRANYHKQHNHSMSPARLRAHLNVQNGRLWSNDFWLGRLDLLVFLQWSQVLKLRGPRIRSYPNQNL